MDQKSINNPSKSSGPQSEGPGSVCFERCQLSAPRWKWPRDSGKLRVCELERSTMFNRKTMENSLFQWPCSIDVFCMFTRPGNQPQESRIYGTWIMGYHGIHKQLKIRLIFPGLWSHHFSMNDKSQWIDDDHPPRVIRIQVNCLTHLSHPRMLFCGCVCFGLRLHIYIFIYLYMCLLLLQHSHEVPGENTCPKQPLILDTTELDLRRLFRTGKNAETSKGIACVLARMLRVQSPRFLSA